MSRRVQRTEHTDDGEDHGTQGDLDKNVARQSAQRIALRLS
jgi:hypothetical protein